MSKPLPEAGPVDLDALLAAAKDGPITFQNEWVEWRTEFAPALIPEVRTGHVSTVLCDGWDMSVDADRSGGES